MLERESRKNSLSLASVIVVLNFRSQFVEKQPIFGWGLLFMLPLALPARLDVRGYSTDRVWVWVCVGWSEGAQVREALRMSHRQRLLTSAKHSRSSLGAVMSRTSQLTSSQNCGTQRLWSSSMPISPRVIMPSLSLSTLSSKMDQQKVKLWKLQQSELSSPRKRLRRTMPMLKTQECQLACMPASYGAKNDQVNEDQSRGWRWYNLKVFSLGKQTKFLLWKHTHCLSFYNCYSTMSISIRTKPILYKGVSKRIAYDLLLTLEPSTNYPPPPPLPSDSFSRLQSVLVPYSMRSLRETCQLQSCDLACSQYCMTLQAYLQFWPSHSSSLRSLALPRTDRYTSRQVRRQTVESESRDRRVPAQLEEAGVQS